MAGWGVPDGAIGGIISAVVTGAVLVTLEFLRRAFKRADDQHTETQTISQQQATTAGLISSDLQKMLSAGVEDRSKFQEQLIGVIARQQEQIQELQNVRRSDFLELHDRVVSLQNLLAAQAAELDTARRTIEEQARRIAELEGRLNRSDRATGG